MIFFPFFPLARACAGFGCPCMSRSCFSSVSCFYSTGASRTRCSHTDTPAPLARVSPACFARNSLSTDISIHRCTYANTRPISRASTLSALRIAVSSTKDSAEKKRHMLDQELKVCHFCSLGLLGARINFCTRVRYCGLDATCVPSRKKEPGLWR